MKRRVHRGLCAFILGRPFADVDHDFQTDLRKQGNQGIDRKGFDLAPHEHRDAGLVNAQSKGGLFLRQPLCLDIVNQATHQTGAHEQVRGRLVR